MAKAARSAWVLQRGQRWFGPGLRDERTELRLKLVLRDRKTLDLPQISTRTWSSCHSMYRTYVAALLISLPEMHAARLGRERGRLGQLLTSLVPTSLWILAGFSGLAKHKSRYLTKLYSITTNCNYLKYRGICLKEVNVDFFIVIYLIIAYLQKSRFCFSDYLVAKGPVIHRLVGIRLVTALYIRCAATAPGFAFRFCALF
jgi:hypothetical protein